MSVSWDMVCSVSTSIASVLALIIAVAQMRLSNKQQLFDRRLALWIKAHGLMELCASNRSFLEGEKNEPEFANDLEFQWMTNNSLLCDIGPSAEHVLEQDWQPKLLAKLEELETMALEAELVFRGCSAKALGTFIVDYAALLMSMYQYQIVLERLQEVSDRFDRDLEKAISAVGEEGQRAELYKTRGKLIKSFDGLTPRMVEQIVGQCKLSRFS